MDVRDYLRILRRSAMLIVALTALGAVVAFSISLLTPTRYTATARAYVGTPTAANTTDLSQGAAYAQQVVGTYADIATSAYVQQRVARELKLSATPTELRSQTTVTPVTGESVLSVQVADPQPGRAADLANSTVRQLAGAVRALNPGTRAAGVSVSLVDPAVAPTVPSEPNLPLLLLVGLLAGLVVGVLAAVLRAVLDTRIRSAEDLERLTDRPVLGAVVQDPGARRHPLITASTAHSPRAEAYRSLRTNLRFLQVDSALGSLVVTSANTGEGKSLTAANLALMLAEAGEYVVLVDGDLRQPSVAGLFGLEGRLGVTEVLLGASRLDQALQRTGLSERLSVLPAGQLPPNPNELVQSHAMEDLLEQLDGQFDRVVIDAPPLLPVSDAAVLARHADGALLVIAVGAAHRSGVEQAVARLDQIGAHLLGVTMNRVPQRGLDAMGFKAYGPRPATAATPRRAKAPRAPRPAEARPAAPRTGVVPVRVPPVGSKDADQAR